MAPAPVHQVENQNRTMLRFDANLRWLFTEHALHDRYAAAARAGFRGVEIAFPYVAPAQQTARQLRENNLKMVQILAPFDWEGGERGIACHPTRIREFRDSMQVAVDYALQIGSPLIHVMAGNVQPEMDRDECWKTFIDNVRAASELAATSNLTVILEPCCRAHLPRFLYHTLEEGVEVIRQAGCSNVKLCFDTFHVETEAGNVVERLGDYFPYLGHVQVADVPGRREPGTGKINFGALFNLLESRGWSGWVGCEYSPSGATCDSLAWASARGGLGGD